MKITMYRVDLTDESLSIESYIVLKRTPKWLWFKIETATKTQREARRSRNHLWFNNYEVAKKYCLRVHIKRWQVQADKAYKIRKFYVAQEKRAEPAPVNG